jgi:hypothetical protein
MARRRARDARRNRDEHPYPGTARNAISSVRRDSNGYTGSWDVVAAPVELLQIAP